MSTPRPTRLAPHFCLRLPILLPLSCYPFSPCGGSDPSSFPCFLLGDNPAKFFGWKHGPSTADAEEGQSPVLGQEVRGSEQSGTGSGRGTVDGLRNHAGPTYRLMG